MMIERKFGSFHVKTEWDDILKCRLYHVTYPAYPAFPMIRFTISSAPNARLEWDEIVKRIREKEKEIAYGGEDE